VHGVGNKIKAENCTHGEGDTAPQLRRGFSRVGIEIEDKMKENRNSKFEEEREGKQNATDASSHRRKERRKDKQEAEGGSEGSDSEADQARKI
jgi:hypothetical protein